MHRAKLGSVLGSIKNELVASAEGGFVASFGMGEKKKMMMMMNKMKMNKMMMVMRMIENKKNRSQVPKGDLRPVVLGMMIC